MAKRGRVLYEAYDLFDVSRIEAALGAEVERNIEEFISKMFATHANKLGVVEIRHEFYDGPIMNVDIEKVFTSKWFKETIGDKERTKVADKFDRIARTIRKGIKNG